MLKHSVNVSIRRLFDRGYSIPYKFISFLGNNIKYDQVLNGYFDHAIYRAENNIRKINY